MNFKKQKQKKNTAKFNEYFCTEYNIGHGQRHWMSSNISSSAFAHFRLTKFFLVGSVCVCLGAMVWWCVAVLGVWFCQPPLQCTCRHITAIIIIITGKQANCRAEHTFTSVYQLLTCAHTHPDTHRQTESVALAVWAQIILNGIYMFFHFLLCCLFPSLTLYGHLHTALCFPLILFLFDQLGSTQMRLILDNHHWWTII